ncbi:MAG: hypothetical protein J07HX64_00777 [halophilic archaeon J07HX64]|jgi:hypothetical protein|nr:MAG: hypothetical protein J07HX64_00777 [halophilic archaeon J07HX64]
MSGGTDSETLDSELPESARTVLLAGPPTDRMRSLCGSLHGVEEETDVLVVSYTRRPSAYAAELDDEAVGDVIVIAVGDAVPSADDESVTTHQVDAPADLTRLGIVIDEVLDGRDQVSVCFDSLTTTLQYADYTEVYEFLHALTRRLRAVDARTHVHINPIAHDEQVFAGLTTLFDARVDISGGGLSVVSRPLLADGRNV